LATIQNWWEIHCSHWPHVSPWVQECVRCSMPQLPTHPWNLFVHIHWTRTANNWQIHHAEMLNWLQLN
jgi:hypothetical protein